MEQNVHVVELLVLFLPVIAITSFIMDSLIKSIYGTFNFICGVDEKVNALRDSQANLEAQLQNLSARLDVFQQPAETAPTPEVDMTDYLNKLAERGF